VGRALLLVGNKKKEPALRLDWFVSPRGVKIVTISSEKLAKTTDNQMSNMNLAVKRHLLVKQESEEETEQKMEPSPTMDEDDESTYVALERDGRGHTACQGVPNLMRAVEDVMDSFEDAVEDHKWFRFLKKKYDAFIHLDDDGTIATLTVCDTKDEDGTLNTFTNRTISINGHHWKESIDGDEEGAIYRDYDEEASIEEDAQEEKHEECTGFMVKTVSTHQVADTDYDYVEDELSRLTFVHGDGIDEDDEKSRDEHEGFEVEDEDPTVYTEIDDAPDDELEEDAEQKDDGRSRERSEVEVVDEENLSVPSQTFARSSMKNPEEPFAPDTLTASALAEEELTGTNTTDRARLEPISPSPSSLGLEIPSAIASFAYLTLPTRDRSNATEESHGSNNTFNTADTTLEGQRVDNPEEMTGNVEVIGVKLRKGLGFQRFWRFKKSKGMSAREKKVSSWPKKIKAAPAEGGPLPPRPIPKARSETKPMPQRLFKEKQLPKTTVIVTRGD
jgi:hypothetical protein